VALGSESIIGPFRDYLAVEYIEVHPGYTGTSMGPYDIALLKLATPSKIRPAVMLHDETPPVLEGLETRALSWSRLETGGPYSKRLLEISGLQIIEEEDCFLKYNFPTDISCLLVTNADICAGGTGGPVIVPSFPDRLIGIALSSPVCNGDSRTTGYISIHHAKEWILNVTTSLSGLEEYE